MKVSLKKSDVFIPEWEDNLELPEDEQIKFHITFLGSATRQSYEYLEPIVVTQEGVKEQSLNRRLIQNRKGMAMAMVTRIENLDVDYDDGTSEAVTDIRDYYKRAMPGVLTALLEEYCLNATSEVDPKN